MRRMDNQPKIVAQSSVNSKTLLRSSRETVGVAGGMITVPELAAAVRAWSDGLCASAASFEARCRSYLRMTVYIRHIFIDIRPRLRYRHNARSSEGRHR